jgi:single-stranded DNA-binding protein
MAKGIAQVSIVGNLVADPRTFETKNGLGCSYTVACNNGRRDDPAVFIDVTNFDRGNYKGATNDAEFLSKGSAVSVVGRLEPVSTYMKKNGEPGASYKMIAGEVAYHGRPGDASFDVDG